MRIFFEKDAQENFMNFPQFCFPRRCSPPGGEGDAQCHWHPGPCVDTHLLLSSSKTLVSGVWDNVSPQWFLNFELALKQESAEAIDSLNWKWWKKDEEDWDNIKIELVDMLHFWVSMCTVAGLSSKDVVVLGVSKDSAKSHQNFIEKQSLNFSLLLDEDLQIHNKYAG